MSRPSSRAIRLVVAFSLSLALPRAAPAITRTEQVGTDLIFALPAVALGKVAAEKDLRGFLELVESYAVCGAATGVLKLTVHERRPNGGQHSFPSGHASSSFTAAEFLRERFGWEWGIPAYVAASYVGYSRVAAHKHHSWDAFAGAGVGIGSACIFTHPFHGAKIAVSGDSGGIAFRLTRTF